MTKQNLFVEEISESFAEADRLMELPLKAGTKDLNVDGPSCNRCTEPACCYQTVYVCLYEVMPMAAHIKKSRRDTPEFRQQLREKGFIQETRSHANWLDLYRPCVLLDEGRCSVYEHRPVRCRTYWIFSPPDQCAPPSGKRVQYANNSASIHTSWMFAKKIHRSMGLKETKMRVLMGSLPRVLHLALEAMDPNVNFQRHIRAAAWPTANNLSDWIDGIIPDPQLVKLKLWRDGKTTR